MGKYFKYHLDRFQLITTGVVSDAEGSEIIPSRKLDVGTYQGSSTLYDKVCYISSSECKKINGISRSSITWSMKSKYCLQMG